MRLDLRRNREDKMTVFELAGMDEGSLICSEESSKVILRLKSSGRIVEQSFRMRSLGELVVFAKAVGCSWDTVRELLLSLSGEELANSELEEFSSAYSCLTDGAARTALELYRLRELEC